VKSRTLVVTVENVLLSLAALLLIAFDIVLTVEILSVDSCAATDSDARLMVAFFLVHVADFSL